MSRSLAAARLPRAVHPIAWWIWAAGLATAASRTTNPLAPRARARGRGHGRRRPAHRGAVGARVQVVPACRRGRHRDPRRVPHRARRRARPRATTCCSRSRTSRLPGFMSGVRIGGGGERGEHRRRGLRRPPARDDPVLHRRRQHARESEAGAARAPGRAATSSVSRSPSRSRSRPSSSRASSASGGRASSAATPRAAAARCAGIAMPVLHDALDRSFRLAAAMDSRGYGRARRGARARAARHRRVAARRAPRPVPRHVRPARHVDAPVHRRARRSRSAWRCAQAGSRSAAAACSARATGPTRGCSRSGPPSPRGLIAVVATVVTGAHDASALNPSVYPLAWPTLAMPATLGILCAALPAVLTPPPPATAARPVRAPVAVEPAPEPVGAPA